MAKEVENYLSEKYTLTEKIENTRLLLSVLNLETLLNYPRETVDKIFVGDEVGTANHCFQSFEIAKGFFSFLKDENQKLFEIIKIDEDKFLAGVLLHDIGKVGISQEILKEKNELSEKEFLKVKEHPEIGIKIINGIDWIAEPIKNIILEHHERMNGTGYPNNLDSNLISIEGKIIAIIDVFEALIGNRSYNTYRGYKETMDFMSTESFKGKFDQKILDLFFNFIKTQPQYLLEHDPNHLLP